MMSADLKPHLPPKTTSHRADGGCCVLELLLSPPSENPVRLWQLLQIPWPRTPILCSLWHCGHTKEVTLLLANGVFPIFRPTHRICATNHSSRYSHLPELHCTKQEEQYRSNKTYCVWGRKISTQNPNKRFGMCVSRKLKLSGHLGENLTQLCDTI